MKKWLIALGVIFASIGLGVGIGAFAAPNILTLFASNQLIRAYGSPGSTAGYVSAYQFVTGARTPSTTGSATETFVNSPCTGTTTQQWLPVTITGLTGTYYVPACQ
jgi:hypothetical protein